MKTTVPTPVADRDALLALACREHADAVLVVEVGSEGLARCVAANRRFVEDFTDGDEVAGLGVAEVLADISAAMLATAVLTLERTWQAVRYRESFTRLPDTTGLEIVVAPIRRTDDCSLLVSWTARVQRQESVGGSLAEANRHLQAENRELARSNFDLNQFAYVASHDLVEPLRMVTSYLDLLSSRHAASLDEQARRYIHFAVDGATRMRTLIDDLLALAKVSSAEAHVEEVDLGALVRTVVADLRLRIEETGATMEVGDLPVVQGDPGQLAHAIGNLVGNAIRFRQPDIAPVITIAAHRCPSGGGGGWRVTVTDNGIGIKPEFRAQVFDMFRRLHPRTAYPGTGMGLAIAKKVVERHGGDIGVDATPDGGSAFWFTLPDTSVPAGPDNTEMIIHVS